MPIYVDWDNPTQSVLRFIFISPWTWDEFYEMHNQVAALCGEVNRTIDVIVDVTETKALPQNALTHFSKAVSHLPPNDGVYVAIGVSTFLKSMVDIVLKQAPELSEKLYMVNNLDEAYTLITQFQDMRGEVFRK